MSEQLQDRQLVDEFSAVSGNVIAPHPGPIQVFDPAEAAPAGSLAADAFAAIIELVALKDLQERILAMQEDVHGMDWLSDRSTRKELRDDYERRKPLAWAAARAVVRTLKNDQFSSNEGAAPCPTNESKN